MDELESRISQEPLPAVDAADVKSVWEFILSTNPQLGDTGPDSADEEDPSAVFSFDTDVIAARCAAKANVFAVFLRTALLQPLLQGGMLDQWRERRTGQLRDIVFEVAAAFPLAGGIQSFDPAAFLEELSARSA